MITTLRRSTLLLCAAFFSFSAFAQGNSGGNGPGSNNGQGPGANNGNHYGQQQSCTITCPGNITAVAAPGACSAVVNYPAPTTTGNCGTVTSSPASGSTFPVGTTTVTVTNGVQSCWFTVTVVDAQAPTFSCPAAIVASTDPGVCHATLSITAPAFTDNCSSGSATGVRSDNKALTDPYPKGSTTITWTATDAAGNQSSCTQLVVVNDTEKPRITSVTATPNTLWSPNHKLADVELTYEATDNCPGLTYEVVSISSNEPLNGTGDGNTEVDWEIIDGTHVKLRAERAGGGSGRIYTITVRVKDASGNYSEASTVTVTVPHDQGQTARAAVPVLDATVAPNPSNASFTIKASSSNTVSAISMVVSDVSGKVVYSRTGITPGQTVSWGSDLNPGTYFVELRQGVLVTQKRVIKTSN